MMGNEESLERGIIAVCLQDGTCVMELIAHGVTKQDFASDKRLALLWRAMVAVHARKQKPDPLTVAAFLREHDAFEKAGDAMLMADLMDEYAVPDPPVAYALSWVRSLRQLRAAKQDPVATKQRHQFTEARERMALPAERMLRYPLLTLDKLRGGWSPGEVDVLAAASNAGKTTLLSTLARLWVAEGRKVFYAGFELPPSALRLQWAAHEAGYLPADIVSGEYQHWPNKDDVAARVELALAAQESKLDLLRCADASYVDVASLRQMGREAADWGCDVFIIDHIDHVDGKGDLHQQSRQVVAEVLRIGKDTGVRFLVATQLNQTGLKDDRLRSHRPVREEMIKQGGHKKEVATFMFGLSRAIRSTVTKEELKAARDGFADVQTIEEPYAAQLNVMKHRWYGDRVGKVRLLSWERGEYTEFMSEEERKVKRRVMLKGAAAEARLMLERQEVPLLAASGE
jgi:replicative DNA helicase